MESPGLRSEAEADIGKIANAHANRASETGFQYEPFGSIPNGYYAGSKAAMNGIAIKVYVVVVPKPGFEPGHPCGR